MAAHGEFGHSFLHYDANPFRIFMTNGAITDKSKQKLYVCGFQCLILRCLYSEQTDNSEARHALSNTFVFKLQNVSVRRHVRHKFTGSSCFASFSIFLCVVFRSLAVKDLVE